MNKSIADQLSGFKLDVITVTFEQVQKVFFQWETDRRNGNCISMEEVEQQTIDEVAQGSAQDFFDYLYGDDDGV